jgi:hypothetical protein
MKMYCYCLSYTDHVYNNLNKQPEGTVIVNTNHTYTKLNKHREGTVIVLAIPTTPTLIWINKQKVLLLS